MFAMKQYCKKWLDTRRTSIESKSISFQKELIKKIYIYIYIWSVTSKYGPKIKIKLQSIIIITIHFSYCSKHINKKKKPTY
jgi:hypothetical protein